MRTLFDVRDDQKNLFSHFLCILYRPSLLAICFQISSSFFAFDCITKSEATDSVNLIQSGLLKYIRKLTFMLQLIVLLRQLELIISLILSNETIALQLAIYFLIATAQSNIEIYRKLNFSQCMNNRRANQNKVREIKKIC